MARGSASIKPHTTHDEIAWINALAGKWSRMHGVEGVQEKLAALRNSCASRSYPASVDRCQVLYRIDFLLSEL